MKKLLLLVCLLVSSSFLQSSNSYQQKQKTNNFLVPLVYTGVVFCAYFLVSYLACSKSSDPFATEERCQMMTDFSKFLFGLFLTVGIPVVGQRFEIPSYKNSDEI